MNRPEMLFIGGDKRRLYTEEYLFEKGYKAFNLEDSEKEFFEKLNQPNAVVVLPLPFTRDGENLNVNTRKISIEEFLSHLKKGDKVFGGMLSEEFLEMLSDKGASGIEYYCEDLILENAELTADAIFEVFSENDIDMKNDKIAILGFGRTAKAIAKRLKMRNADFSVVARSEDAETNAKSMDIDFVKLNNFTEETQSFDAIINTIPALILNENHLREMKRSAKIVDIASAPFGVTEEVAERCEIQLIRALGLPGKYYPDKAGELIGKKIDSLL